MSIYMRVSASVTDWLCYMFIHLDHLLSAQDHDRVREQLLISVESPQFHTAYSYSYDLEQNHLTVLR